jgi:hypothetical protein
VYGPLIEKTLRYSHSRILKNETADVPMTERRQVRRMQQAMLAGLDKKIS